MKDSSHSSLLFYKDDCCKKTKTIFFILLKPFHSWLVFQKYISYSVSKVWVLVLVRIISKVEWMREWTRYCKFYVILAADYLTHSTLTNFEKMEKYRLLSIDLSSRNILCNFHIWWCQTLETVFRQRESRASDHSRHRNKHTSPKN